MTNEARAADDFYSTPEWVLERFLRSFAPTIAAPARILEPAAGDGALLSLLADCWPAAQLDAFDLHSRHTGVTQRDFWFDDGPERYDLVITNPPYVHAEAFVRYGLEKLAPGGRLALLLRLGFLGSLQRRELWQQSMAETIWVLSERPSFRNGTTDFSEYAWFVWKQGSRRKHARLRVI